MEKLSLPKNKIKVLLLENIHKNAVELFKRNGYGSVELVAEAPLKCAQRRARQARRAPLRPGGP